jgi:hypothetical protein
MQNHGHRAGGGKETESKFQRQIKARARGPAHRPGTLGKVQTLTADAHKTTATGQGVAECLSLIETLHIGQHSVSG